MNQENASLDNVTIYVYTQLNNLAQHCGLRPSKFIATYRKIDSAGDRYTLTIEAAPNSPECVAAFNQFISAIGITEAGDLVGQEDEICDRIDDAIQRIGRIPFRRR